MAGRKNDWFSIVVLIVALITLATGIVGSIYLDQLLRGTTTGALSKTAVESLFAMSIVITILAFVLLVWCIWRLVVRARKYETSKLEVVTTPPVVVAANPSQLAPMSPYRAPTGYMGLGAPTSGHPSGYITPI